MKVFISHSTADRWIARRISQDLESLGIDAFLDEKDIATGDSIDDTVQQHLRNSDEILILLSPSSINSAWVLMEIGGAMTLGKRLVPVLLHISANEIPAPISKTRARDLNGIEGYYIAQKFTPRLVSTSVFPGHGSVEPQRTDITAAAR